MTEYTNKCQKCKHTGPLSGPSNAWKCVCAAISDGGCTCDHLNVVEGAEDNPPDNSARVAELKAELARVEGNA